MITFIMKIGELNNMTTSVNNKTRKLNSESGFTLIEIIIVVALIAIAVSMSGLGLSVIKQSNVESMGHDIVTEFRDLKYRAVSDYDKQYEIKFIYTGGKFGYEVYQQTGTDLPVKVKTMSYRSDLVILAYNEDTLLYVDITDTTFFDIADPLRVTYTFDTSTGGISSQNLASQPLASFPNASGTAKYMITDTTGTNFVEMTIIKVTGRVIINEL